MNIEGQPRKLTAREYDLAIRCADFVSTLIRGGVLTLTRKPQRVIVSKDDPDQVYTDELLGFAAAYAAGAIEGTIVYKDKRRPDGPAPTPEGRRK